MPNAYQAPVSELTQDPSSGQTGFVAFNADRTVGLTILHGTHLYRSTAHGVWTLVSTINDLFAGSDEFHGTAVTFGAGNVAVLVATNEDTFETRVLYSSDGGLTWTLSVSDLSALDGTPADAMLVHVTGSTFVLTQIDPGATQLFLTFRSTDNGVTWTQVGDGPTATPSTLQRMRVIGSRIFVLVPGRYCYSDNNGTSWSAFVTLTGTGTIIPYDIVQLGLRTIIVGVEDAGGTPNACAWQSLNDGTSFSRLSVTGASALLGFGSVVVVGDELVAGGIRTTAGNVLMVSRNGTAWTPRADALPLAPTAIQDLTLGHGQRIYGVSNNALGGGTGIVVFSLVYAAGSAVVDVYERGNVAYLLSIEGAEAEWVSHPRLAGASNDGRTRYDGLVMEGATISEQAELREGVTKIQPLTLRIASPAADREFGKAAISIAVLTESVDSVDGTTAQVSNGSVFTEGQYVHLGTECWQVTDIDGAEITVTRQMRNTLPQQHLINPNVGTGWTVPLYDKPPTLQGRRARLYAVNLDDPNVFAVVWQGRVGAHPYLEEDGVSWHIDIEHLTTVMDQTIGEIVNGDAGVTGIYYHRECQFSFSWQYTNAGDTTLIEFAFEGVYESDDDLTSAVLAELSDTIMPGITSFSFLRNPSTGFFEFRITTDDTFDAGDQISHLRIGSPLDGVHRTTDRAIEDEETYTFILDDNRRQHFGAGGYAPSALTSPIFSAPRGMLGDLHVGESTQDLYTDDTFTESPWIIRIDRDIGVVADRSVITLRDALLPDGTRGDVDLYVVDVQDGGQTIEVATFTADDTPDVLGAFYRAAVVYYDSLTRVTSRVAYGQSTNWRGFLQNVVDSSSVANTGSTPFLTGNDLETDEFFATEVTARLDIAPALLTRDYQPAIETPLIDVIRPELVASGCLLRMSENAAIGCAVMTRPSPLAQTTLDIDDDIIVTPYDDVGKWPGMVPSPDGIVCTVIFVDGERKFVNRDEMAISHFKNRGAGTLELEFESERTGVAGDLDDQTALLGKSLLGFFGSAYSVITVPVTFRAIGVLVGDLVRLVSPHIVDAGTGERGVDQTCMVIGREWPLDDSEAYGTLTLLSFNARVGGYAPCLHCANPLTDISDPFGDPPALVTFTVLRDYYSDPDNPARYDLEHFAAGDFVRGRGFDTATPMGFRGVVTAIPDAEHITINVTDYIGDVGIRSVVITFDKASEGVTANQERYVYIADENGEVEGEEGFNFE